MTKLYDVARVLRSKNSGPFELTFDIIFDDLQAYEKVKKSQLIQKQTISRIYRIAEDRIQSIVFFDQAMGVKITIARDISSGTIADRDVYGAQQHAPLMNLEV